MDSLAFLKSTSAIGPLYVLHGDEAFLKRQVLHALRDRALGPDADDQSLAKHAGDKATYAAVWDELQTVPFFAPRRIVMVLLDQEILKLAIYVGDRKKIDVADVDRLVGNNRAESTWKIFDALAASQAPEALAILDRALDQGEEPLKIMGAFSMQLRRL